KAGLVVDSAAADLQQSGLAHHAQGVLTVGHRFALSNPALVSALSKKSFSSASWPILACSGARSTGSGAEPAPKTSAARSSSWRFHSLICVGCSSNSLQSSAMVLSSRSAASATLALNAALCERRVRRPDAFLFIISSLWPDRLGPAQCTEPALSHLFKFAGPLL